jgi:predicted 2-oxoglutarate/Fe(II)-dependent dioxygenase YbiX
MIMQCGMSSQTPLARGEPGQERISMEQLGMASADGKNGGVDLAFNRPGVFSAQECNALIGWAEAERIAELERIDDQKASAGTQRFIRRNRQLVAAPATNDRTVAHFQRKLRRWIAALNERIWHFHVTHFGDLMVVRYEAGDEVGLHMDLDMEYCDRKLAALVQLSPADAYQGGTLGFGLPILSACPAQGSLLVFPAWVPHRVTPVTSGIRHTAVCAVLGPSFR